MRISEFAKKLNLSTSTVRYYINQGLLMPNKKKNQYDFGAECISDMEKLMKYKQCRLSLEEIQRLFFLEKASRFHDEASVKAWKDILLNKKRELQEEQENIELCLQRIEEELCNAPFHQKSTLEELGVPLSFLQYLYCPDCGEPLKLQSASLSSGMVYCGELSCVCGYQASVCDGMIQCVDSVEDSPLKTFNHVDSVISMMEFSSSDRMLMEKAYLWLYNQILGNADVPQVVMAGPFSCNFMLKYLEKLDHDNTFIFIDPSRMRIRKLQQYFRSEKRYNMVFIAGSAGRIPVKKRSVDIYIDDYSTSNSLLVYNDFGIEDLTPLLKCSGKVYGVFTKFHKAPKTLHSFKQVHPDFSPEKMTMSVLKSKWTVGGMPVTEQKKIGQNIIDDGPYHHDMVGEILEVYGYIAEARYKK